MIQNKETRIGQVLQRIVPAFSYSPPLEANKETRIKQGFSYSQWLEENAAKRLFGSEHGLLLSSEPAC
jgi:hypothetical protein